MESDPIHRVEAPPAKPLVAFDGDCGFCRRWVERLKPITEDRVDYEPSQEIAARFPEIPQAAFDRSVQLIEPDGTVTEGARAVARILAHGGRTGWLWSYEQLPGLAIVTEAGYRWVSGNRDIADPIDRWLLPDDDPKRTYRFTRAIFLRGLGLIYLFAFASLWVQIDGLIGRDGILPVPLFLSAFRAEHQNLSGLGRFFQLPTLCWLSDSNAFLHALCGGGVVLACLLIIGLLPVISLVLLWLFYLSLVNVGQDFLPLQWDWLLLETGFLAIFVAPLQWRLRPDNPPPWRISVFLLRWLLFRLMFLSGAVKLLSRDLTWRAWSAMRYHYETQPLPTWTSWYMHQLPNWFQAMSVGVVFFVELLVPFLMLTSHKPRHFAFVATVLFQLLIIATGNYGFFNLLTIVLCVTLLDDATWERLLRRPCRDPAAWRGARWPVPVTAVVSICMLLLSVVPVVGTIEVNLLPRWGVRAWYGTRHFYLANVYGLFASMTTDRPELIIEGSNDGTHWQAYEFKWKPGDIYRRPRFCVPHMPRLDWQMWFSAIHRTSELQDA
jgi:predicted DCC family thiol-disulfide oxidoreductase YuxK